MCRLSRTPFLPFGSRGILLSPDEPIPQDDGKVDDDLDDAEDEDFGRSQKNDEQREDNNRVAKYDTPLFAVALANFMNTLLIGWLQNADCKSDRRESRGSREEGRQGVCRLFFSRHKNRLRNIGLKTSLHHVIPCRRASFR